NSAEARFLSRPSLDEATLVRDEADADAANAHVAANDLLRQPRLEFVDGAVVDERVDDLVHVVRHAMVGWQYVVQVLGVRFTVRHGANRTLYGQHRDELAELRQTGTVVVDRIVRDAARLGMCRRAAECFCIDRLTGGALHEVRTAEFYEGGSLDH